MIPDRKNSNRTIAVFRFHLSVGIRLALRVFIPVISVFFAMYYLFRPEFFNSLSAQILDGGFLLSGLTTTTVGLTISSFASRRVCLGLNGWIRHLPAAGILHRRMAGIAVFLAQIPVLAVIAGLAVIAMKIYQVPVLPYIAGLPFVGLACALCVLPVEKKHLAGSLAVLAGVCAASNNWAFLGGGILLLIAADSLSGPLVLKKRRAGFHLSFKGMYFLPLLNWRALRWRVLIPYVLSLPFLGATQLFIANNDPDILLAGQMIRFGGAASLAFFCGVFSNMLATRRPPWPWSRSLTWSARTRIIQDTSFIGFHTVPLLLLAGTLNPGVMLPLALSLPLIAAWSAYSIRRASQTKLGALGNIVLLGAFYSFFLCLIPWSFLFLLAFTPLVIFLGIKAEKHQRVSRWLELHHFAAGDSLSWSER